MQGVSAFGQAAGGWGSRPVPAPAGRSRAAALQVRCEAPTAERSFGGGDGAAWRDRPPSERSSGGYRTFRGRGRGEGRGEGRGGRSSGGRGPGRGRGRQQQQQLGEERTQPELQVARIGQGSTANFFSAQKFEAVGASEEVVAALKTLGVTRPSHIQVAAYRALAGTSARHVVLADHAGSGKTLAYLLPLLQAMRQEEGILGAAATQPRCPRLVVLAPTAELCAQVLRVCKAISRAGLPFRSAVFTGGRPPRTQREALEGGVDVAVGTPGRMAELLKEGALDLSYCRAVVCDEVDVLMGDGFAFAEQVRPLHAAAASDARFVFATATIPDDMYLQLEEEFPELVAALGPGLHRTAPGILEQLVDCSGGDEVNEETGFRRKAAALFAVLQEQRALRTIVFCNKIDTCRAVENFLNRSLRQDEAVEVLPHHAAIVDARRGNNLQRFLTPPAGASGDSTWRAKGGAPGSGVRRGSGDATSDEPRLVLVCTDRASRGIDSTWVEHVVLFDMPRDPSEYVRRVGRTARGAGGQGVVTVLALGRQVKLARDIIDRNQKGLALHRIPAALPVVAGLTDAERVQHDLHAMAARQQLQQQAQQQAQGQGEEGDGEEEEAAEQEEQEEAAEQQQEVVGGVPPLEWWASLEP